MIFDSIIDYLISIIGVLGGFGIGWAFTNKMKALIGATPKVEKRKNDSFSYEDDKPKRLALNEDGELEDWE